MNLDSIYIYPHVTLDFLHLERQSEKNADIYVNGDKVQTNSKEISTRINEALGKLVASVYHKLSYIDTAMSETFLFIGRKTTLMS